MIRFLAPLLILSLLAACGVDGDPIPPEPRDDDEQSTNL
ncbi:MULTISPECIES: argininosuccinate lyase [Paracoccaceae]|jgi:predicted small lipoprotein YifL|nr:MULTISPECIES: argininosuccinate lyase [Paracoccaceae]